MLSLRSQKITLGGNSNIIPLDTLDAVLGISHFICFDMSLVINVLTGRFRFTRSCCFVTTGCLNYKWVVMLNILAIFDVGVIHYKI